MRGNRARLNDSSGAFGAQRDTMSTFLAERRKRVDFLKVDSRYEYRTEVRGVRGQVRPRRTHEHITNTPRTHHAHTPEEKLLERRRYGQCGLRTRNLRVGVSRLGKMAQFWAGVNPGSLADGW